MLLEKWGDHKALHWTLPGPQQDVQPVFRLRPTADLRCPKDYNKEDWLELLEKVWFETKHYLPPDPNWAQLCRHAERICINALDRIGMPRRIPRNSHKGDIPVMQIKTSHHRTRPDGPDSVELARLRRLWRRMTAWHTQHITTFELKKAILRETSVFGCPYNPLSKDDCDECFAWLSAKILACETSLSTRRLQNWQRKIRSREQEVWKWLRRDKQVEPVQHVLDPAGLPLDGHDLFKAIESFWRGHWPTAPPDIINDNYPASQDEQNNPPQLPPITS